MPTLLKDGHDAESYLQAARNWAYSYHVTKQYEYSLYRGVNEIFEMGKLTLTACQDEFPDLQSLGIEYIPAGHPRCKYSVGFVYIKLSDPTMPTVMLRDGNYRIGDIASILAKGNYGHAATH